MRRMHGTAVSMIAVGIVCWAWGHFTPIQVSAAKDGLDIIPADLRPCDVAVVDLGLIFKKDRQFNDLMEEMRADVQTAEEAIRARRDALVIRTENLKDLVPNSDEHKTAKSQIAKESADIQLAMNEKKEEFMSREATIYHQRYETVMRLIERHCEKNGIRCVMRFAGEEVDANDPQSILKNINKQILYHKNIDITDAILESLQADN